MESIFRDYIQSISTKFSHKETSEMGYRTDFEVLLKGIFETIKVQRIDHDAKAKDGNKPDFVLLKGDVPILYIEAKDIGISLDKVEKSEQMARYFGYANLVLTDYVEFRFYRNGLPYGESIKIGDFNLKERTIKQFPESYGLLFKTLIDFSQSHKEPIKSGRHLAKIMGGKAQRIRDNIAQFLSIQSEKNNELMRVYEAIKKMLVHDLSLEAFADMYAQTLVYGLFVARYYDDSPETFSRQEARDLVPASNPFLQHFFDHIAGPNFDKRLSYIVDELCEVFAHADTKKLVEEYMEDADPIIHFYEDFLKEYDSELRKKMGAYYTPLPVVNFIVRSVDYILQKDFNLPQGLADTSKLSDGRHKVQILDPAVGTGTFISATIRVIYERLKKQKQDGRWPTYVHNDLLPRLYGFELMMAPYTIAHLKLSLAFKQTGFWKFYRRLGIYLTNSLEQGDAQQNPLSFGFAESIAEEAKEASVIKNQTPIMVVIGNPPYSGISSNETEYANSLVEKYKVEPGGKIKLQEQKHWLNDDYVKFIALAESMVSKNQEGIMGMITAHGYIDNPTFRGMRWCLRNTFDSIYVLDLHGNSNKKETALDGSKDENVFNIKTGVSIILGVKKSSNTDKELAIIYKGDLFGLREDKFKILNSSNIETIAWKELPQETDFWLLEGKEKEKYKMGFSVADILPINNTGICTQRDQITIQDTATDLKNILDDFSTLSEDELKIKYAIEKDGRDWKIKTAKEDVMRHYVDESLIKKVEYRPFDTRYTFFTGKSKGFIAYPRGDVFQHFFKGSNLGLIVSRQGIAANPNDYDTVSVSNTIVDLNFYRRGGEILCPLYLYQEDGSKTPNLKKEIVSEIEKITGEVSPENIVDYIYASLYSPSYREKYREFLKIDFPRVPYPKDKKQFFDLVRFGTELREIHLLESPKINQYITSYPVDGSNIIEKISYKGRRVYINAEQYFGDVPETAWNFYIGGYQPAQKWLKDRKRHTLTNTDIEHYQKIIVALTETDRIMKEIDKVQIVNE